MKNQDLREKMKVRLLLWFSIRSATLLKKRLQHRCFPVNFEKFLRASFLQNTAGRMPLNSYFYDGT